MKQLYLAVFLIFALTGCGNSNNSSNDTSPEDTPEKPESPLPSTPITIEEETLLEPFRFELAANPLNNIDLELHHKKNSSTQATGFLLLTENTSALRTLNAAQYAISNNLSLGVGTHTAHKNRLTQHTHTALFATYETSHLYLNIKHNHSHYCTPSLRALNTGSTVKIGYPTQFGLTFVELGHQSLHAPGAITTNVKSIGTSVNLTPTHSKLDLHTVFKLSQPSYTQNLLYSLGFKGSLELTQTSTLTLALELSNAENYVEVTFNVES